MRKLWVLLLATSLSALLVVAPAQGAVKAATVAQVGDQCLRDGKVAPGRAIDGSDLVCMKATLGSSKGELLWWYQTLVPMKMFEVVAPIISRSSDSPEVIASRSADRIAKTIGTALKAEELVKDYSAKNFTGNSGTLALSTFQAYKNRLATSFIGSLSLINGIITTKSTLKLADSKAIAQLVQEYEAIAVPSGSKYTTIDQLINDLKANPKSVTFIGGVAGGVDHVFMAKFLNVIQVDPLAAKYLPQSSGFDVVTKTLTDKSYVALSTSGDFVAQVNAGKLRVLGIASPEKVKWLKAKTLKSQYINIVYGNWYGIFLPPLYSEPQTNNFIHLLDVLHNSHIWLKTLEDNYWSEGYVGQKDFVAQIEAQTAEAKSIISLLGLYPLTW
jgi:putative tricarboxylic transport membrane protein